MARKAAKTPKPKPDFKSSFIYVNFSQNDEKEIKEWIARNGVSALVDLVTDVLGNGGSIKFTHSSNDGSVFTTLTPDKNHDDYGGYQFGFRYASLDGAIALADYIWHELLLTDKGLPYLPTDSSDWLNLS